MPEIHRFYSSGEAYDASQTHNEIHDGDVLVVERENAIAILVSAWPVIFEGYDEDLQHNTAFDGPLHHSADWHELDGGKYTPSVELAQTVTLSA